MIMDRAKQAILKKRGKMENNLWEKITKNQNFAYMLIMEHHMWKKNHKINPEQAKEHYAEFLRA